MDSMSLDRLWWMPELLRSAGMALPAADVRARAAGSFSFVEHAWHLADLEREGYGTRITRLLGEDEPELPDFDGDRIARERDYQRWEPDLALRLFAEARRVNLGRLAALDAAALGRRGRQVGVGVVYLADIPHMMAAHDRSHVDELLELLSSIAPGLPVLAALGAYLAASPAASPSGGRSHLAPA
jgi:DinB superfamily